MDLTLKILLLFFINAAVSTDNLINVLSPSKIKNDIKQIKIFQSPLEIVTKLKSGAEDVASTVNEIISGEDPFLTLIKYIYNGTDGLQKAPKDRIKPDREYDFIIVGAGTAGCVLANRLTEVEGWKVLLIEAGGDEFFFMDIPLLAFYLQQTPVDWQYATEPSNLYCNGLKNNQCLWPRGKVLGGTSTINQMIYTRGSSHDYDHWRDLGNEGWGYDDVLKYFRKLETFNVPGQVKDPKYRGYDGPLSSEHAPFRTVPVGSWVQAAQEAGHKYVDYNAKEQCGVSHLQLTTKNGARHSANRAYLYPASNRKNLHVVKHSLVTKLLFNEDCTTVTGVIFERLGVTYKVFARKEVVLSAGALNTPQILMLSGIGPRKHLEELGVPVKRDLPVGYNLMDHLTIPITFRVNPHPTQIDLKNFIAKLPSILYSYVVHRRGPLSFPDVEAIIYQNFKDNSTTAWPDIELLFIASSLNAFSVFKKNFAFKDDLYEEVYGPLKYDPAFMVFPTLIRPKSKCRMTLKDTNPRSKPIFHANYFENEEDLDTLVKGINAAISLIEQPALKSIGAKLYDVPLKHCLQHGVFGSDEYWKCFIRAFTLTFYHFSGTCKMGPTHDGKTVVDSRLRVYNVKGLRVIDASIFPEVPTGHTNVPTFMTAEKGADLIKEDWDQDINCEN